MLENAVGICGANFGNMFLYEDDAFRTVAMFNAPNRMQTPAWARHFIRHPIAASVVSLQQTKSCKSQT